MIVTESTFGPRLIIGLLARAIQQCRRLEGPLFHFFFSVCLPDALSITFLFSLYFGMEIKTYYQQQEKLLKCHMSYLSSIRDLSIKSSLITKFKEN